MPEILNSMRLSFPSRAVNERFARLAVAGFIAGLDPTVSEVTEIKTAVSEAVTNCIVHAYADSIGDIYITAKIAKGGKVTVTVRDAGCGIPDTARAMEPMYTTSSGGERSGMGFTIMESFMDKVHVWSKVGKGTRVTMEKILKPKTGTEE